MKLVGAKQFLKLAKCGTFFIQFWCHEEGECYDIIREYEENNLKQNIFEKHYGETCIFGDNTGSLSFEMNTGKPNERDTSEFLYGDDEIPIGDKVAYGSYYDLNIVGDADPTQTLYLIFDNENDFYNFVIKDTKNNDNLLTLEELKLLKDWFLKECDNPDDETEGWAMNALKTSDWLKDDPIVNYGAD